MRTDEMIIAIREQALEFDHDPVSDEGILRRMNFAYNFAYNHFAKSDEALYAKYFYITLKFALSEYDLPKDLWGKRALQLEAPTPPQTGYQPFNFVPIDRVDPQSFTKYDSPRARTLLPLVWTQRGNKINVAPPPLVTTRCRVLGIPSLPPLGLVEGLIQDIDGGLLTLDRAPTDTLSKNINALGQNIVSICDGVTGEVKALYPYSEVTGNTIRLSDNTNKTNIRSKEVRKLYTHSLLSLTYNAAEKTITATTTATIVGVSVGDFIELSYLLTPGGNYNISDALTSDSDFYDPPEYVAPASPISRGGQVTSVSSNSITWIDTSAVPTLVNGYRNPPGAATSGTVISAGIVSYLGNNVVRVTFGAAHGLAIGSLHKVVIAGTGSTLDGVRKCIVADATRVYVLQSSLAGASSVGTWALYQYPGAITGWPALTAVEVGTPAVFFATISIKSPYTYTLLPAKTTNDPDAYDHAMDIAIDDIVVWGYATGIPIIPEAYHEILVQWAVMTLKSSMNESDNEMAALLKENITAMKGDTAGRRLGVRISRDFGGRSNHLTASRKFGRR